MVMSPQELSICRKILAGLTDRRLEKDNWVFLEPVKTTDAPSYTSIVKRPMDLKTVGINLSIGYYQTREEFYADVKLIFDNAELYNTGTISAFIVDQANKLRREFEKLLNAHDTLKASAETKTTVRSSWASGGAPKRNAMHISSKGKTMGVVTPEPAAKKRSSLQANPQSGSSPAEKKVKNSSNKERKPKAEALKEFMKYLHKESPWLQSKAREIIRVCFERFNAGEPLPQVNAVMDKRLKECVGDTHWKAFQGYLDHFMRLRATLQQQQAKGRVHPQLRSASSTAAPKQFLALGQSTDVQQGQLKSPTPVTQHLKDLSANKTAATTTTAAAAASSFSSRDSRSYIQSDAEIAADLQQQEIRLAKEIDDMLSTPQGLAYKFVERMYRETQSLDHTTGIKPVAVDDLVFLTEALLKCKETFLARGKDAVVNLGFHFTKENRMDNIQRDGLMTRYDRELNPKLSARESTYANGAVFGDGVYTGDDAVFFKGYGSVGIIVARLMGKTKRINPKEVKVSGTLAGLRMKTTAPVGQDAIAAGFDSIIGNKTLLGKKYPRRVDETILLRSEQCIPLIRFPASLIPDTQTRRIPAVLQPWVDAMKRTIEDFFNSDLALGRKKPAEISAAKAPAKRTVSKVDRPSKPAAAKKPSPQQKAPKAKANYFSGVSASRQPISMLPIRQETITYNAPESISDTNLVEDHNTSHGLKGETCTICFEELEKVPKNGLAKVKKCQHIFCRGCILEALHHCRKCPNCKKFVGEPLGKSPSGTMSCLVDPSKSCEGHEHVGRIQITYEIYDGIQKKYHETEGKPFKGIKRTAYLPDNDEGRRILKRLKYAFSCGLTFTIGTSLTTLRKGVVTWASIHHKTSSKKGTHGWPDPRYFINCTKELDGLGVPQARDCPICL